MLGAFLPYITNLCSLCIRFHTKTPNYLHIAVQTQGIFENSMKTQGFFQKLKAKIAQFFAKTQDFGNTTIQRWPKNG